MTSITSVSVCDSSESIQDNPPEEPEPGLSEEELVLSDNQSSISEFPDTSTAHICLEPSKSVLNKVFHKSLSLMRIRPELICIINSVLVPLFISSLVELKPADSKKLYAAYDEGPFFRQSQQNKTWNFHDIHDSSLDALDAVITSSKATVVLSYAHWSVNSLDSRDIFLNLAAHFSSHSSETEDGVHFVAIDCWLPSGKCRNQSRGLSSFPRISIIVPEVGIKVRYNGPLSFQLLKQEIESLLQPYIVVRSLEHLRSALTGSAFSMVILESETNSHILSGLYQLRAKLSVGTFPSPWSKPTLMVSTSKVLNSYMCNMDCGLSSLQCLQFVELKQRIVLIYKGQKVAKVFILNNGPTSTVQQLWETIQTLYAPESAQNAWIEALKSDRVRLPRTQMEMVDSRIISSMTEVISKKFDFTFILHSFDENLVLDFLALKRSLDSCKKNYKKLYCSTLNPELCGLLENNCSFCQFCSKYDNLPSVMPFLLAEMSSHGDDVKKQFLETIFRKSVQLFCYFSIENLLETQNLIHKDINMQKSFSVWRSAIFAESIEKNIVVHKIVPLSRCRQNSTIQFAFSTSSDITPSHSTENGRNEFPQHEKRTDFIDIFAYNTKQVFRINITSIDDALSIMEDFVTETFNMASSDSLLLYEYPPHFIHKGLKPLSDKQEEKIEDTELSSDNVSDKSSLAKRAEIVVSRCDTQKVWQGNNSMNCLVLHYTSWCGFCKTVLHVFHTVSRLMTSKFPNVTEFVQINSAIDHVPWQHSVSKLPAIVFYPAASSAAVQNSNRRDSPSNKGSRVNNFTYVYPADVAITVPNLYGFVRLHSGVY